MDEFEKAMEIVKLIEKYCDDATSKVYTLIIRSSVAFNRKEKECLDYAGALQLFLQTEGTVSIVSTLDLNSRKRFFGAG